LFFLIVCLYALLYTEHVTLCTLSSLQTSVCVYTESSLTFSRDDSPSKRPRTGSNSSFPEPEKSNALSSSDEALIDMKPDGKTRSSRIREKEVKEQKERERQERERQEAAAKRRSRNDRRRGDGAQRLP
jgi:hypothetical protein